MLPLPSALTGLTGSALAAIAIGYLGLITVVALAAVFSTKPARRRAAYEVLLLLLLRRGQGDGEPRSARGPARRSRSARRRE